MHYAYDFLKIFPTLDIYLQVVNWIDSFIWIYDYRFIEDTISVRTGGTMPTSQCRSVRSRKNDWRMWKYLCIEGCLFIYSAFYLAICALFRNFCLYELFAWRLVFLWLCFLCCFLRFPFISNRTFWSDQHSKICLWWGSIWKSEKGVWWFFQTFGWIKGSVNHHVSYQLGMF